MVGIDAKVVTTGSHLTAELDELLKKPAATIEDTPVPLLHLQVQVFRTIAQHAAFIDKPQAMFVTELDYLLLDRSHDIDVLNGMLHLTAHTF